MPPAKRKYSAPHNASKRTKSARRFTIRRRRISRARPMRSLKTNYRAINTYRFTRETMPQTLPFSIIAAGTSFPAMGYLEFANLQFNQLVQSTTEFGNLFARYKVDKIETILTPMFQEVQAPANASFMPSNSPALRITRINTKYFNGPTSLGSTSDAVLSELAQIQSKTVTPYASRKSLKLVTLNPMIQAQSVLDTTSTEITTAQPAPWMNISNQADVPFRHNSVVFAERTDGQAVTTDWKYRVVHKVYFRCAQVG